MWCLTLQAGDWSDRRLFAAFLHDDGRVLPPTARHIWDHLLDTAPEIAGSIPLPEDVYARLSATAQDVGEPLYRDLLQKYEHRREREQSRQQAGFDARLAAARNASLPTVRDHRVREVEEEYRQWHEHFERNTGALPELVPVLVLRVNGRDVNG